MSSSGWSKEIGSDGAGILSQNCSSSPHWCEAAAVFVPYCSSDSWSGTNATVGWESVTAFAGAHIVDAVFADLQQRGILTSTTELVFSGSSAGAEGLYPHVRRVAALHDPSRMAVLVDSGFFLDSKPYRQGDCRSLMHCTEAGALQIAAHSWALRADESCAATYGAGAWQCMLGPYALPHILLPSLTVVVAEFRFDQVALLHDGITSEPTSGDALSYAQGQAMQVVKQVTAALAAAPSTHTVAFLPSCFQHTVARGYGFGLEVVEGVTLASALQTALTSTTPTSVVYADTCDSSPSCNPTCT
jgi:hypothetical protein